MRSSSAKAVSVTLPVHVSSRFDVAISVPWLNGPPPNSVIVPFAARLKTRKRPPALAAAFDSDCHTDISMLVRVKPPDGVRPEIHAIVEPAAVFVAWISVPEAVVFVTAVSDAAPATVERSYRIPSPEPVIPFAVVLRRNNFVAT